ncbi:MAG: recombination-associated protein RdgC [Pseudomonadota bacterium]|nr:recombination-associated protein RdgC [Pseudomonadota bacterium]
MWFKNLHIFRFLRPFTLSAEALHEQLSHARFHPCGQLELGTQGWVPPLGRDSESLVHAANKCFVMTLRKEDKILPATVIRDYLHEKIEAIELQQHRKIRKPEKEALREEILLELLPRAFSRSTHLLAYIDVSHHWLLIDTANRKKAEEFINLLRRTLGSLPVVSPILQHSIAQCMTQWLNQPQTLPPDFELADACELIDREQEGAVVNCKRQDLTAEEIQAHLEAGKSVTRLALIWQQRLALVLDAELVIRRVQFLDVIQEQAQEIHVDNPAQRFDADFALMSLELAALLKRLFEVFGGEDEQAYARLG